MYYANKNFYFTLYAINRDESFHSTTTLYNINMFVK